MNCRKLLIVAGILLFIAGCSEFNMICSLNPFYLEKNVTLEPGVEGNWRVRGVQSKSDSTSKSSSHWKQADTISIWNINQFIGEEKVKTKSGKDSTVFKPSNFYVVKLLGNDPDSIQNQYHLTLFKIKGSLYGDFSVREITAINKSRMAKDNYFSVHTLARIQIKDNQLFVSWLGDDAMKDMIENKRVRIKYRYVPDVGRLLLTASSDDLTAMITRYADQTRFIDWGDQKAMLKFNRLN